MRFVLYAILAYILYQFIFKLVIPVYLTSRKIKKGFAQMQEQMNDRMRQQQGYQSQPQPQNNRPDLGSKPKSGDYLDFEEIK